MKTIDELGIGKHPWNEQILQASDDVGHWIIDANNDEVCAMNTHEDKNVRCANARLIAAERCIDEIFKKSIDGTEASSCLAIRDIIRTYSDKKGCAK